MKLSSAALAAVLVLAACGNADETAAQDGGFPEPNTFGSTERVVPGAPAPCAPRSPPWPRLRARRW
ncbi:hypothetical protein [Brevundimonas denitrificans]|uniref:hypothetical protein n=1 Tax=Brevundimonas denitrificans TaxID=1443434 RepID=UPI00223C248D|nr:hypothetical protein [Brevundimonas denitrificans]